MSAKPFWTARRQLVWDSVLRNLASENITYQCYAARGCRIVGPGPGGPGEPDLLEVEMDAPGVGGPPAPPKDGLLGTVIIDARGFDRWGFVDDFFATSPLKAFFAPAGRKQIESDIARDLSVCVTSAAVRPSPRACTFRRWEPCKAPHQRT